MITGFESFQSWFKGYESQYTIIGGTACDILMTKRKLQFRATKDIDLVLIVEALTPDFGVRLWQYIKDGGYQHCNKNTGEPQFYRFTHPKSKDFPTMIELFARKIESISLPKDAVLTPLPLNEDISSLSAILLNDDYYAFLRSGNLIIDGITVLGAEHLIPFKIKAWIDLSARKTMGDHVDSKDIKKHRNDVFRLTELLINGTQIPTPASILADIELFTTKMLQEDISLNQLGIVGRSKESILKELREMYINSDIKL